MFDQLNHHQLITSDEETISYITNFDPENPPIRPYILFNYGLVCSNHHWSKQVEFFNQNYNLIFHDYRGHYQSTGIERIENITFKRIVLDMKEILTNLKIKQAHLIGHSMGVNISLEYAVTYPQDVLSLTLISGTVVPVKEIMFDTNVMEIINPVLDYLLTKYPTFLEKFWWSTKINPIVHKIIHLGGFNKKTVPIEFVEIYIAKLAELGPKLFFQLFNQMSKHDILTKLEKLNCPSLIIGGDRDKVIPNYLQFLLTKYLSNSSLYIVRNGSHVPQVDFPELINERIDYFFKNKN